jgi:hypothetical protein
MDNGWFVLGYRSPHVRFNIHIEVLIYFGLIVKKKYFDLGLGPGIFFAEYKFVDTNIGCCSTKLKSNLLSFLARRL